MKNDMIERYIYAVTKRMNPKVREDVSMELRGLIDDMLLERCGDETPTDKDVRVVLTELGTPQELYAKYDDDKDKCLIGQPYYSTYKFVMKIALFGILGGLAVASLLLQLVEPQPILLALGEWFANTCEALVCAFAVVTIVFAVMQRKGMKVGESFSLDELPAVPKKKQKLSVGECIFNLAFIVVFLVLFLAVPQVFCAFDTVSGTVIPVFATEVIRGSWYLLLAFGLVGVIRESVKLMERQFNKRVFLTVAATNVLSAGIAVWWLSGPDILNPIFLERLAVELAEEPKVFEMLFANFNGFLMMVILLALVLDTVEAAVKTFRKG